jgi:hypothetical protein
MTDVMIAGVDSGAVSKRMPAGRDGNGVDAELVDRLVEPARTAELQLTGEGGLLRQLTKRVLESALDGEITDHLGYDKGDRAGKDGGNSRNGKRTKTVLTDAGPVPIDVPRDRDGSFDVSGLGQGDAWAVADHQPDADLDLQPAEVVADRGLGV